MLHKCDNRLCVNPDHLFLGTVTDNIKDMDAKGRRGVSDAVGSKKGSAALVEADITRIRALLRGSENCRQVAERYGVGRATISDIKLGRTWQHVG